MRKGVQLRLLLGVAGGVLLLGALLAAIAFVRTLRYGFSVHDEPTAMEAIMASRMRRWSVPAELRTMTNPVPLTPEALADGRAHFADHCASCHGNDGKGDTEIGRHLYPRAPDMTLPETQSQSDGALFATIENGIRLTGMPGWGDGTAESAYGSWALVHFIRHLPQITDGELAEMERLNPKSPQEWQEEENVRRFLAGEDVQPAPPSGAQHQH